ncbi:MAG TPA: FkbM family methyltransferase [bacterium]|nr:FkbM family methyltransferase [bacterium]
MPLHLGIGLGRLAEAVQARLGYTVDYQGVKVHLDTSLGASVRRSLRWGDYEGRELELVRAMLQDTDVVMEVGAGLGVVSTFCAKAVGSERVFAYEANPAMEEYIRRTYALNGVSPTLEVCALGEHGGEQVLCLGQDFSSATTLPPKERWPAIIVPAKCFDDEVRRRAATFLIVDIEGAESELCRYARFPGVQHVIMELHGALMLADRDELIARMHSAGFQLDDLASDPPNESEQPVVLFSRA